MPHMDMKTWAKGRAILAEKSIGEFSQHLLVLD